jgi:hypothetical protein
MSRTNPPTITGSNQEFFVEMTGRKLQEGVTITFSNFCIGSTVFILIGFTSSMIRIGIILSSSGFQPVFPANLGHHP